MCDKVIVSNISNHTHLKVHSNTTQHERPKSLTGEGNQQFVPHGVNVSASAIYNVDPTLSSHDNTRV